MAEVVGADPGQPLQGLDLELIAATLSDLGTVGFVRNADAEIGELFNESPAGVAVLSVEHILLLDDHAEIELRLWCGSLGALVLTPEVFLVDPMGSVVNDLGQVDE